MSAIYPKFKEHILEILKGGNIKLILIDEADYTYDEAHEFLSSVPASARVGTPSLLTNVTTTGGVFDADDVTMAAVAGDAIEAVLFYQDTGTESTSRLVYYADGVSFTPNGSGLSITFDSGINKIFRL